MGVEEAAWDLRDGGQRVRWVEFEKEEDRVE